VALTEQAVDAAETLGDVHGEMLGKAQLGLVFVSAGRLVEGMRLLDEATAAAVAGELADPSVAANVCCYLVTACARVRDFDRAAEWSRHVMEQSREWSNRAIFSYPRSEYATVLTWWGRWDEAEVELQGLIDDMAGRPALAALGMVRLADLRRCQGRHDEAAALLDDLDSRPARGGLAELTVAARARLLLDRGDRERAAEVAEAYLHAVPPDDPVERVEGLEVLARARAELGDAAGAQAAAAELADTAATVATPAMSATALRARGVAGSAAGDAVAARSHLERAVAALDRAATPFEAARVRLDLAPVLAKAGDPRRAVREAEAAAGAFDELGSAYWGERARRLSADLRATVRSGTGTPMSAREVDVLRLVGRGRSNEEIAGELFLSVRTVERHVSNIYAKLGATGRTARAVAAAYAQAHGLT
jgi:ATP/maltotriose-dependent transcriptional regulator MalT